jgi:hypothetical protein
LELFGILPATKKPITKATFARIEPIITGGDADGFLVDARDLQPKPTRVVNGIEYETVWNDRREQN